VLLLDSGQDEHELSLLVVFLLLIGELVPLLDLSLNPVLVLGEAGPLVEAVRVEVLSLLLGLLLGVVPSTTSVGGGDGNLNTGDDGTGKDTLDSLRSEEDTGNDGGNNDEEAGGNHVLEGGGRRDGDALLVVGLGPALVTLREANVGFVDASHVGHDLEHHLLSSIADGNHGEGREPVGEHGTDQETGELDGLEDVDLGLVNTGNESTEQGETDEAGGANGETLADGGSGVTGGVEGISSLSGTSGEASHLSNTTGIVGDRSIAINGEGNGQGAEHAEGGKTDTVHAGNGEGVGNGGGDAEDGDDAGSIAEGEAVDDVGGGTLSAGLVELLGGAPDVGGVVLGNETNDHAGPEAEEDAAIGLPVGGGDGGCVLELEGELVGEDVHSGHEGNGHDDGGDAELGLEDVLDSVLVDGEEVGEEHGGERSQDSDGGHDQGVVEGIGGLDELVGGGRHNESSAGGLGEGAEEISTHTSDVANIVTDVVGNSTGVLRRVLLEASNDLADEIGTNISGLGVDTATDSAEESNGGASEAVASNKLEVSADELGSSEVELGLVSGGLELLVEDNIEPGGLVDEEDDLEDQEGQTDEGEAEHLTTLEGSHETFLEVLNLTLNPFGALVVEFSLGFLGRLVGDVVETAHEIKVVGVVFVVLGNHGSLHVTLAAHVGGAGVGVHSDSHTDVAGQDRRGGANQEGDSGVGEVRRRVSAGHLSSVDGEADHESESQAEKSQVEVFGPKELDGTVGDESADVLEFRNDVVGEGLGVFALSFIVVDAISLFFFEVSLDRRRVRNVNVTDNKDVDQSPDNRQDSAAKDEVVRPTLCKVDLKIVSICHR